MVNVVKVVENFVLYLLVKFGRCLNFLAQVVLKTLWVLLLEIENRTAAKIKFFWLVKGRIVWAHS